MYLLCSLLHAAVCRAMEASAVNRGCGGLEF